MIREIHPHLEIDLDQIIDRAQGIDRVQEIEELKKFNHNLN